MAKRSLVTILGVGDVGPQSLLPEPPDFYIEPALATLEKADIRFAQCERVYSERGSYQLASGGEHVRQHPRMASVFKTGKFDVVSLASNHTVDWGREPVVDTWELFHSMGIETIGAGKDIETARRPAILQSKRVRVAFLGYCSVLREEYSAGPGKPGVAPMRAHTYYEAQEYQPGTPPKVVTVPYPDDLAALESDVRQARRLADVVVMSIHWGVHFVPKTMAMYEREVMMAAIDAGADLILGHGPHILKAVETYNGKVCFHSLANFCIPWPKSPEKVSSGFARVWQIYGWQRDPDEENVPYSGDFRKKHDRQGCSEQERG